MPQNANDSIVPGLEAHKMHVDSDTYGRFMQSGVWSGGDLFTQSDKERIERDTGVDCYFTPVLLINLNDLRQFYEDQCHGIAMRGLGRPIPVTDHPLRELFAKLTELASTEEPASEAVAPASQPFCDSADGRIAALQNLGPGLPPSPASDNAANSGPLTDPADRRMCGDR